MSGGDTERRLEQALDRVDQAILPSLSMMLDSLLDAASLARPGTDADAYAAEIRTLAVELESVARQIEAFTSARRLRRTAYLAASAPSAAITRA